MLVMPFGAFQAQGRIMKSTKAWRDEVLAAGSLVEHEEGSGQIVIFISHTWWDRSFRDATNDPNNPYDKGAPDWQTGEDKNLKWRVICVGVQRLLEQEGLKEEEVSLWVDWQSIYHRTTRRRSSRAWSASSGTRRSASTCSCQPRRRRSGGLGSGIPTQQP